MATFYENDGTSSVSIQTYYENDGSSSTDGPLAVMETTRMPTGLRYPRDVGTSKKAHVVRFDIKKINHTPITQIPGQLLDTAAKNAKAAAALGDGVIQATIAGGTENGLGAGFNKLIGNIAAAEQNNSFSFPKPTETNEGYIELYMPENIEFSYTAIYNNESLSKIIGDTAARMQGEKVSDKKPSATQGLFDLTDTKKLLLSRFGYAFNPQQQTLFDGIEFRPYQMTFTFTPYSAEESREVNEIIKTFRKNAAPSTIPGSAGFFFEPPSVFDVSFRHNGAENKNLNKIYRSVLKGISVNYAPNGWSAHNDGSPVQTTMSLDFQEIVLVDRTKIEKEFTV